MTTFFIFHGIDGHPEENWFPWLKKELEKKGYTIIVPHFPNANHPQLEEWLRHFEQYQSALTKETILVGHSLGSAFALRLLERSLQPVLATFLVASVSGFMDNEFDPLMTSFTSAPYDWSRIRKNAGKVRVIHSDNDPYIAQEKAETLAKNLGVNVTLFPNGGHFNTKAGFRKFPKLLDSILETMCPR